MLLIWLIAIHIFDSSFKITLMNNMLSACPDYCFIPSSLSAAQSFPEVSSSHASVLSEMRKLLW